MILESDVLNTGTVNLEHDPLLSFTTHSVTSNCSGQCCSMLGINKTARLSLIGPACTVQLTLKLDFFGMTMSLFCSPAPSPEVLSPEEI